MSNEKSSAKDEVRFNLRLPSGLHQKLTGRALLEKKSLNSLVTQILERAMAEESPEGWKETVRHEMEQLAHVRRSLQTEVEHLESRQYVLYRTWAEREGEAAADRELGPWKSRS